jgi:hypothetical protein
MNKVSSLKDYMVKPPLMAKNLGKQFKASGGKVLLEKDGRQINFIFEVVRREEDWVKKLVDKMKFYNDFYNYYTPGDSGFNSMPQLIFICEDDKHIVETFKAIVINKLESPKLNFYYTTDLKQNEETLTKSLVTFKMDETTHKYKLVSQEVRLLA